MPSRFSLFQSHLDLSHLLWQRLLSEKNGLVIDATMGNGHDTLFLASALFPSKSSKLIGFDIDERGTKNTFNRLEQHGFHQELKSHQIELITRSHVYIDQFVSNNSVALTVYNLGYLPGGNTKEKTTQTETTLESLVKAASCTIPGGVISVTCYPGHSEGEKEMGAILEKVQTALFLSPNWNITSHFSLHRKRGPVLLLLQKAADSVPSLLPE